MKKRIVAVFLGICMIVSFLPVSALAVDNPMDNGLENVVPTSPSVGREVWIDGRNGNDENNGASIDDPVRTIQKAMELAGEGGTIIVKEQITIEKEPDLTLENVTIKRMDEYPYDSRERLGRILYISESTVTLKNVVIDGNMDKQGDNWGASPLIWSYKSKLTISGKTELRNDALKAMELRDSDVTMEDGEIYNIGKLNNGNSRGIELYDGSQFTMKGGSIHDIKVADSGAAFYTLDENSKLIMTGGEIYDNHGKESGGAIYFRGTIEITGGKIYNNSTGKNAGAIMIVNSTDNFIGGTAEIYGNSSGLPGFPAGAIRVVRGTLTIGGNAVIRDNKAGGGGGGVCLDSGTVIVKDDALIYNNTPGYRMPGADISIGQGATLTIYDISKRTDLPEFKAEIPARGFNIDGWYYDGYDDDAFKWISAENVVKVDFKAKDTITFQSVSEAVGFIAAYEAHKVYYQYITETEGASLPSTSDGLPYVPKDNAVYIKGNTITLEKPSKTQFVGPKSDEDNTLGVWTFKGWKYRTPEKTLSDLITTDTLVVSEDILVENTHVDPDQESTCVDLVGIWEWSQEDVPWYYEVYYETFNEYGGTQWNLLAQEECEPADPTANVSIVPDEIVTKHQNELKQNDILTGDPEQLGDHYVYYDGYSQNRLSAQAGDASEDNPLKIYFKAAEHQITYQYEGTIPDGATDELPAQKTARYRQTVNLDEPELIGYTFSGWSVKEPNGAQKLLEDGELTMPNTDVTLVGSWTERDPAVISPADMTVYMGGEAGYDGILDANGNVIPSDSLPEPFFKITLPSDVDQDTTINMIYLNAYNADDSGSYWMLIPCGEGSDFYRSILFSYKSSDGQKISLSSPPIKFTKGNDVKLDDSFDPAESLHQTLTMEIWENLAAADVAELKYIGTNSNGDEIDGQCKFEFIKNDNGLIVRGTTENPQYAKINAKSITEGTISAATPEGTTYTYYVDGQDIPVWDDALEDDFGMTNDMDIALLVDDIINSSGTDRETALKDKAEKYFEQQGIAADYSYQFKHLDLVDRNNGNALVAASEPVTVSWPIPEGVELTDEINFKVLHFKGLNREDSDLSHCTIEEITPTVENGYATFSIAPKTEDGGGFSPFALAWGKKEPTPATYNLTYHANDGTNRTSATSHTSGAEAVVANSLWNRTDYVFTSWNTAADGSGTSYTSGASITMTSSIELYAQWRYTGGTVDPDPDPTEHTLRYETNSSEMVQSETKKVSWTKKYGDLPTPQRDGYTFAGWYRNSTLTMPITGDVKVYGTVTIYAKWNKTVVDPDDTGVSDWLDAQDHRLYLVGYPDSTFGPDRNMTRAEVAQMFYALLLDQDVRITQTFSDVPADAWYATAVNTLASLGMMDGYPDGTFHPNAPITRAEFATVALAFAYEPEKASCDYYDVFYNTWYYPYVAQATSYDWIGGYPDGSFRPNNFITRAEVTVIVNNMLGRSADERYIDRNADKLVYFTDLTDKYWAYYTIMEATNSHDYTKEGNTESWIKLNYMQNYKGLQA